MIVRIGNYIIMHTHPVGTAIILICNGLCEVTKVLCDNNRFVFGGT